MTPRLRRKPANTRELLSSKYIREAVRCHQDALHAAGVDPSPALRDSISLYIEMLLRWNRKLNLTAITEPREIVSRNFVESFLAVRWLPADDGQLCDVGSGAGFPGLALKLVRPHWRVILLEPTAKKAAFLAETARSLGLRDVQIERCRWQESKLAPASIDALTSRALGGYRELVVWAKDKLRAGGRVIFWVGSYDADGLELLGGWQWERSAVPGTRERVLLMGRPV
jgi:16S rRNA (guanine527-N7)-methyltransferase